ncbi:hypothetical protein FOL46_007839 [Perkinsus olseni]|uniref:Uncharacterized protein n=1 Tax=Perkinsus olseni TaxID=32597 RepID=A0A7J6LBP7_PEROL|nr:hypothetical protein FOL46_007839 [Perkinsus olseni]
MGPLLPSRVLLKSASTFTGVLQQFARTAASRESGGVKGAWAQLLDPLPQRKEAAGGDEKALGQLSLDVIFMSIVCLTDLVEDSELRPTWKAMSPSSSTLKGEASRAWHQLNEPWLPREASLWMCESALAVSIRPPDEGPSHRGGRFEQTRRTPTDVHIMFFRSLARAASVEERYCAHRSRIRPLSKEVDPKGCMIQADASWSSRASGDT